MGTDQLTLMIGWFTTLLLYVDQYQLTLCYNTLHSEMLRFMFEDEQSLKSCAIATSFISPACTIVNMLSACKVVNEHNVSDDNLYLVYCLTSISLSHAAKSNS